MKLRRHVVQKRCNFLRRGYLPETLTRKEKRTKFLNIYETKLVVPNYHSAKSGVEWISRCYF